MGTEAFILTLVITIPTYFLSKWVLEKFDLAPIHKRKKMAVFSAAVLSPLIFVGIISIWLFCVSFYPKIDFDQVKWSEETGMRYEMSQDLIEKKLLIGMTQEEVVNLLGDDYISLNENHMQYELGYVPAFITIDPDVLEVIFKEGKAIQVEQYKS